ncbi:MAG: hypothetical protein HUJ25_12510 [Crocinitomicaceae bacterium]|nr:hypothetical protein [Crocinitomicaceae bacterium]
MEIEREETLLKVHGVDGYNKACKHCREFFWTTNVRKIYCSDKCRNKYHYRKHKKTFIKSLLKRFGLGVVKNDSDKKTKTPDYPRLTFLLSVIGFIGSIGFYLGVLHQVYHPDNDKVVIEQLRSEKKELQNTIQFLIQRQGDE